MNAVPTTESINVTAPRPSETKSHFWAGSGFSFHDLLDAINPLQHLPIIGTIYRAVTGDTIGNVARVVGDGIYGGPIGAASGLVDVAFIEETGKDVGAHVMATLEDIGDLFGPGKPKPAAPAPSPDPLIAAARRAPDPPKLPLLGSATTASELQAAAPISPLLAPKLAAQAQASQSQDQPAPAGRPLRPLSSPSQGIPIDVSDRGIALMRATSAAHNPQPIALHLPAGAMAAPASQAAVASTPVRADFAERMRDGLAKYDAMMAAQARDPTTKTVDQVH